MKWDEMTRRERDALVWEKVIGGKLPSPPYLSVHFPHYSTDISAAWGVVEVMKPTHALELRVGSMCESARFTKHKSGKEFIAQCKTASESICKAALKAVGVDIT
jgi:hypothetical protein